MTDQALNRRQILATLTGAVLPFTGACAGRDDSDLSNSLLWAVAWKQTAAEYAALCHQAYNLARMQLERAILSEHDKPLAVVTDMDDTILHAGRYWGDLVSTGHEFFDDAVWDAWIAKNEITAAPGAAGFLNFCAESGVEVFYVTSRDQGERSFDIALANLRHVNFPYADPEHLTVLRESSDKSPARERIARTHEIALLIGDNLNDYKRDYYIDDIGKRMALMERDREDFGRRFIVLPNPTDGHWVRAIFGESEPAPTDENRRKLKAAASGEAWARA